MLRALPDRELDAAVAASVFGDPKLTAVPCSTSWDGTGRIVEHLRERGYTLQLYSFKPSQLDWMNNLPSNFRSGHSYQPAEVTVVDFRRRLPLPPNCPNMRARANNLPRAVAVTAVLIHQIEQGIVAPPATQAEAPNPNSGWSEERHRQHSEKLKAAWQRRRAAGTVASESDGDDGKA
ncbi:MAG TPA: hypothetical protein VJ739_00190 [Gemmataceae bacterium]|nr:hypothetical protein [Gemmataceae bacterium]